MNDDPANLDEHGYALLALQLRQKKDATGADTLSDDDLVALYEGDLDDEERARVLRCIANDKDVYRRWLALVEATYTVDTSFDPLPAHQSQDKLQNVVSARSTLMTSADSPRPTFGETLLSWFKPIAQPVGALALAATLVLLILPGAPNYEANLDQLYRDHGFDAEELLRNSDALPTRTTGHLPQDLHTEMYSPAKTALAKGLLTGLQSLGDDAAIPGIAPEAQKYSDKTDIPDADRDVLVSLGRFAALAYAHCQRATLTERKDFFPQAISVYLQLNEAIDSGRYDELKIMDVMHAHKAASDHTVSQQDICTLSSNLINQFRG
ncbi:MAG: hypothetical protein ACR2RB_18595 [Gammaproteobacteria bacterium]